MPSASAEAQLGRTATRRGSSSHAGFSTADSTAVLPVLAAVLAGASAPGPVATLAPAPAPLPLPVPLPLPAPPARARRASASAASVSVSAPTFTVPQRDGEEDGALHNENHRDQGPRTPELKEAPRHGVSVRLSLTASAVHFLTGCVVSVRCPAERHAPTASTLPWEPVQLGGFTVPVGKDDTGAYKDGSVITCFRLRLTRILSHDGLNSPFNAIVVGSRHRHRNSYHLSRAHRLNQLLRPPPFRNLRLSIPSDGIRCAASRGTGATHYPAETQWRKATAVRRQTR